MLRSQTLIVNIQSSDYVVIYANDGGDYENILLKDIYPLKGLKLYYLFDFGNNWLFEMRKSRKTAKLRHDIEYPCVVSDNGIKQRQYYY